MAVESLLVSGAKQIQKNLVLTASEGMNLVWAVKGELNKFQTTLTTIQGVLDDAEDQQVEKKAVKNWLRRLRSVAYDAEDVLDEFKYEALQHKMETHYRMIGKVWNLFSRSNIFAFCLKMAHKHKDINEVLDGIRKDATDFNLRVESASSTAMNREVEVRQTFSIVDDSEVVGRVDDTSKLLDMLVNTNNDQIISIISIVGMGGIGKTAFAQLLFNDTLIVKHFDLRMWVCVSRQFEVERLLKEIIESAGAKCDASNLDVIACNLQEKLMGRRFLLVLDVVWSEDGEKWDNLIKPLKSGSVGCKVIVTTQSNNVAKIITPNHIHHMGILSEQHCSSFLSRRAFSNGVPQETSNLVEIGRRIVSKCGGVPLAVKVLGSLMHKELEWSSMEESEIIWNSSEDNNSRGIMSILKLSYDHLASHLKRCFAYCSVFPKDYIFYKKKKLIQLWMAEGFLGSKQMEDVGNKHFNSLYGIHSFKM